MISRRDHGAVMCGLFFYFIAGTATAQAPGSERKPTFSFSMSNVGSKQQSNGPLFQKVKAALQAANDGNGEGFVASLAKNADLRLLVKSSTGPGPKKLPFTTKTVRDAMNSCIGPYSFDEGSTWVQLAWVCRVDADAPLSKTIKFQDSPELTLTVFYKNGLIKSILAMEPLPIPGGKLLAMDAYNTMPGGQ